ncbi:MAG: TetR family transcriptional regulator [Pseudonocardia sp.]|nr:TetR family transcriptional regulator [Pseudonocardia sp.]
MPRALRADAARNRDRLAAAAAELFGRRGLDVPLEEVARQAGVSIGTLYNHFPNRDALCEAVFPERLAGLDRLAERALADPDPGRAFDAFLYGLCEMQAADGGLNESIARHPPGTVDIDAECGRAPLPISVLERARAAGAVRADFGPERLVALIWAMSAVISYAGDQAHPWQEHLRLSLAGIRVPEPCSCAAPQATCQDQLGE